MRQMGVSEVTYYRWRQEFGGLRTEPVTRCDFVVQCGVCPVRSLAAAITSAAFAVLIEGNVRSRSERNEWVA
jgi:hypothetical protein